MHVGFLQCLSINPSSISSSTSEASDGLPRVRVTNGSLDHNGAAVDSMPALRLGARRSATRIGSLPARGGKAAGDDRPWQRPTADPVGRATAWPQARPSGRTAR